MRIVSGSGLCPRGSPSVREFISRPSSGEIKMLPRQCLKSAWGSRLLQSIRLVCKTPHFKSSSQPCPLCPPLFVQEYCVPSEPAHTTLQSVELLVSQVSSHPVLPHQRDDAGGGPRLGQEGVFEKLAGRGPLSWVPHQRLVQEALEQRGDLAGGEHSQSHQMQEFSLSLSPPCRASEEEELSLIPPCRASEEEEFSLIPPCRASEEEEFSLIPPCRASEEEELRLIPPCRASEEEELSLIPPCRASEEEELSLIPPCRASEEEELSLIPPCRASEEEEFSASSLHAELVKKRSSASSLHAELVKKRSSASSLHAELVKKRSQPHPSMQS
ncbi:hypothetical protein KUCAC02_005191 [Chaenocephalus aceratus]|uniref:Uncharacterized protein n=1 Tax=Chaenocephalus aceratus TaxID=36190 RepID=A0ACB9WPB2_CHAAC|nr:hypothetical protein KUCAC02_005191 [Chaenocephalus aceratus]